MNVFMFVVSLVYKTRIFRSTSTLIERVGWFMQDVR